MILGGFFKSKRIKFFFALMALESPVLEIGFGPPSADFGSIWSSLKARKFRHVQKTSKVRTLYFDLQSLPITIVALLCFIQ